MAGVSVGILLHRRLRRCVDAVRKIARALLATGATVEEDPNSIDIFARWNSRKLIIEAKTVELESLVPTLRFAVGQVLEYTFRSGYSREEVDLAIAVDHLIAEDHWSIEWLTEFLGVGLICCAANSSRVYLPSQIHCDEWNIEY